MPTKLSFPLAGQENLVIEPPTIIQTVYPEVTFFSQLPSAVTNADKIYIVRKSQGVWPFSKSAGLYQSTDGAWEYLGENQGAQGPQGPQGAQGASVQGPQGPQGAPGDVTIIGGDAATGLYQVPITVHVPAYSLVTARGEPVDTSNVSQMGKAVGLSLDEAWPGASVVVCFFGTVSNPAWNLEPDMPVFANGTSITNDAPSAGWVQLVGTALSPTTVFIQLGEPVRL